ncbi:uncharacterized protein TNCV_1257431 [Trichonephila clavipes]|nr:uncharacterized protein TNCV_1257431 [Trichonephila clavipes]
MFEIAALACMHTQHRRDMEWWTCSKIPRFSRIAAAALDIHATRSLSELKGVSSIVDRSMFRQVLMHPSKRLMIPLPPRWIFFPIELNSNTPISVGLAVNEVDICPLGVRITIHAHRPLSMSEMSKSYVPTLRVHVQRHLSFSAHTFLCHYGSSRCFLPPFQVCTRHSGTPCRYLDVLYIDASSILKQLFALQISGNMLTKYQMIKFIVFCEVWFLPESVARVAALPTLPKLIWCGSWGCNLGQSLSNRGQRVFYRRKIRRASRPGKHFNLVICEEPVTNLYGTLSLTF